MNNVETSRQKGVLILTEARSGSNWLGSLLAATGRLGQPEEWFTDAHGPDKRQRDSGEAWIGHALSRSSTDNGFFAIKLFVPHVFEFHDRYGIDLLRWFRDNHDTRMIRLSRRDRVRQAISLVRGFQTRKWRSGNAAAGEDTYDFAAICRAIVRIDRSFAYWQSCATLYDEPMPEFVYEDLVADPSQFIDAVADHAGARIDRVPQSALRVQRDGKTEEWLTRFKADRAARDMVDFGAPITRPRRSLSNFLRLAKGRHLKPYHYRHKIVDG